MIDDSAPSPPAFYAAPRYLQRGRLADWWILLHPPYTLWHLSYVAIGAALAPEFSSTRLVATLVAFFLAVGLAAHALDELHDRPLRTAIPDAQLVTAAALSLLGAVAIGAVGVGHVGPGLVVFIVVGVVLNCGYNLELLGGRLHNDRVFALGWGAFPVLTAYFAQAGTLGLPALFAAGFAYSLSVAQRALSTQARTWRRRTASIDGSVSYFDGRSEALTRQALLTPVESALKATTWSVIALATGLTTFRILGLS
jgi:hypothetical protein